MPKTEIINTRVTPELKAGALAVLDKLDMTMSEAITIFLNQITLHKGIPFEIKVPNHLTEAALEDARNNKLSSADSVDSLFAELGQ